MAFGPINVDWACMMQGTVRTGGTAELDIGEAITHLPLSTLPQRLGCGDVPLWDRWIAHPTLDAYWRAHAATTFIDKVKAPAMSLAGWHDDSRGPMDYTDALLKAKNHPAWHIVMGVHAHKGVDYVAGDYGAAIDTCRNIMDMKPQFTPAWRVLGASLIQMGCEAEGVAELEAAAAMAVEDPVVLAWLAHAKALRGECSVARTILEALDASERYVPSYHVALAFAALQEPGQAFEMLDRACEERDPALINVAGDPRFDPIRADPRFSQLLERLHL
jgi:hypothetical protein